MSHFEIVLAGARAGEPVEHVVIADAYAQEGPLTTFFNCESTHVRLDSWAERLASFRSSEIRSIRRVETVETVDTRLGLAAAGLAERSLDLVS